MQYYLILVCTLLQYWLSDETLSLKELLVYNVSSLVFLLDSGAPGYVYGASDNEVKTQKLVARRVCHSPHGMSHGTTSM